MRGLDKSWRQLIIIGIAFLVFYTLFGIFQSLSGANSEFNKKINVFQSDVLLSPGIKKHLTDSPDFQK